MIPIARSQRFQWRVAFFDSGRPMQALGAWSYDSLFGEDGGLARRVQWTIMDLSTVLDAAAKVIKSWRMRHIQTNVAQEN